MKNSLTKALHILPDCWGDHGGRECPNIDGKVEDGEECLELSFLLRELKLVTAMRRDAGLDSSGAYGNKGQTQDGELAERGGG